MLNTTGGPALGGSTLSPAMTSGAVSLLQEHLAEEEKELWTSLGTNWTSPWSVCVFCVNLCLEKTCCNGTLCFFPAHSSVCPSLPIPPSSWTDGSLRRTTQLGSRWKIQSSCSTSRTPSGKGRGLEDGKQQRAPEGGGTKCT